MRLDLGALTEKFAKFSFSTDATMRRRVWLKLAKLIENGVQIRTAIDTMRDRREKMKGKNDNLVLAYGSWLDEINNGKRFSDAIEGWVAPEERMLIASGEQSGKLESALRSTVTLIESGKQIRSAVIGGLIYPVVLLVLSFGIMHLFGYKIIPAFSRVIPEDKWTGIAASMVDVSHFVQNWLWLVAILVIVLFVAFFVSLPIWVGAARVKVDAYAPYSIYRIVKGSTWMIAFSALVEAGVRAENALQMLGQNASPWLTERIDGCLAGMRNGYTVGDSLARAGHGFPDIEVIDDLGVYSSLSSFDQALAIIGREMMNTGIESVQKSMVIVFNVGLIVVALLLSWMISGMLAMQMQMASVLSG